MPGVGPRGQNLEHLRFFSCMESFVFEQQVLFRVESLCDFQPLCLVPMGGGRGQNLGHLKKNFFSFIFHTWDHKYLNKRYYLELTTGIHFIFSDTQCLFKKIAPLVEILKGSLFFHLMTIGANTVH